MLARTGIRGSSRQKKWIGNATFGDLTVIWAKDGTDGQVNGFIVANDTPGFSTTKLEDKIALRIVQNAVITLDDVSVSEDDRLQNANSFRDTAEVLRMTRASVAPVRAASTASEWRRSCSRRSGRPRDSPVWPSA